MVFQNAKNVQETFINTKNSLLKPFLDHRVQNVREVSSKTSPWRKQDWIPRNKFHDKKLSFVHKKETEHSFELSLSIYVFYRSIFNLKMQNFGLENHDMMTARQPFCWWMSFTEVSNPFLSPLPKGLAIWLSRRGMDDLISLRRIFFPNLWSEILFPRHITV